ncbi:unnamed protein product [Cyprideis torosa]|uniref:Uncharacterized protein n=1 Tax=Cyprideis torosa TaxID=163714 RepID=A0A7R8WL19_9CRUS|nr:unnamed protein product [Cyprideis torosa]CAG0897708.1 unnamed protein product [Cyprideis torosa]
MGIKRLVEMHGRSLVSDDSKNNEKCEPITIPLCTKLPYNRTIFPNLLRHPNQEEAGMEVHQFFPLVKVKCSPDLQFFLCTVYAPVCTILDYPVPPCRDLCESAKSNCEDLMNRFGFPWPENLNCDQFPAAGETDICVPRGNPTSLSRNPIPRDFPQSSPDPGFPPVGAKDFGFVCPIQFRTPDEFEEYTLRVGDKVEKNCGAPCDGMFFSQQEREFARMWIFGWSVVCVISCSFTLMTFLIEMSRFAYPEKPIIYLCLCYFMIATTYIVGHILGNKAACIEPFPLFKGPQTLAGGEMPSLISQGTKKEACTILFMLLYFFTMAASIWWVILALTWYLAAGLKWGVEAIEKNSQYYHLAAWATPAVMTIAILAMGKVEGDVLSGVCYVGLWDPVALRVFVLGPLCVFLALGILFLLLGFDSLFRIRTIMKHGGTKTDKLEKLMARIIVFSGLYVVPGCIVMACLIYEQSQMESWMVAWQQAKCRESTYAIPCPILPPGETVSMPNRSVFTAFMLKYLMTLMLGVTSGFWIWSKKTLSSWSQFCTRLSSLCCRNENQPIRIPTNPRREAYV